VSAMTSVPNAKFDTIVPLHHALGGSGLKSNVASAANEQI
jgi:hypothetical protein